MPRQHTIVNINQLKSARTAIAGRRERQRVKLELFFKEIGDDLNKHVTKRLRFAAQYLVDQTRINISTPTGKRKPTTGTKLVTAERSKPGEYPRIETGLLRKTIFYTVEQRGPTRAVAKIGTPLDYGAVLETSQRLRRSYILRTYNEQRQTIAKLLTHKATLKSDSPGK